MAFADSSVGFTYGDKSIIGCFNEQDEGHLFEFSENNEGIYGEFPHKVWVGTPWHMDSGWRYANVKKTVAYILTNDENGEPVVEKWNIKSHRVYDRPEGV